MVKYFNISSVFLLALGLVAILMLYGNSPTPKKYKTAKGSDIQDSVAVKFPEGEELIVKIDMPPDALFGLSEEEQLDQIRDWLLVQLAKDSGLPGASDNRLLNIPATRKGLQNPGLDYEYGSTRSLALSGHKLAVLVPWVDREDEAAVNLYKDRLGQLADRYRSVYGQQPTALIPFEYDIDLGEAFSTISRRKPLTGNSLFTEEYGYHEAVVNDQSSFETFLNSIDHLTYFKAGNNGTKFCGRKLLASTYHGIQLEDVAALWQAEVDLREEKKRLETKLNDFDQRWRQKLEKLNNVTTTDYAESLVGNSVSSDDLKMILSDLLKKENKKNQFNVGSFKDGYTPPNEIKTQQQYDAAFEKFEKGMDREASRLGIYDIILPELTNGFSIETIYDFKKLQQYFNRNKWALMAEAKRREAKYTAAGFERIGEALENNEAKPLLGILNRLGIDPYETLDGYREHIAVYNKHLRGTELAMILYYTDLLTKYAFIDYLKGRSNELATNINAPIHKMDFGYRDQFARASYTHLQIEAKEKATFSGYFPQEALKVGAFTFLPSDNNNYASSEHAAFVNWWNSNFAAIGKSENHFQRLNEIAKWADVMFQLGNNRNLKLLDFLKDVRVNKSHQLGSWVTKNGHLKDKRVQQTQLNRLSDRQFGVEQVSFRSESAAFKNISGSISFFQRFRVPRIRPRPKTPRYRPTTPRYNPSIPKTPTYTPPKVRKKSSINEIKRTNRPIERTQRFKQNTFNKSKVTRTINAEKSYGAHRDGFHFESRFFNSSFGMLRVRNRISAHQSQIVYRNGEMGEARAVAEKLAASEGNPQVVLAENAAVETYIKVESENIYFVKLNNSEKWVKYEITAASENTTYLRGINLRNFDQNAKVGNVNIELVEQENVIRELDQRGFLKFDHTTSQGKINFESITATQLPNQTKDFNITFRGSPITGKIDVNSGQIFVSKQELALLEKGGINKLYDLVKQDDLTSLRSLAKGNTPEVSYVVPDAPQKDYAKMVAEVDQQNYATFGKRVAEQPKQVADQLSSYRQDELQNIESLLNNGNYYEASIRIEKLENTFGLKTTLKRLKNVCDNYKVAQSVNQHSESEVRIYIVEELPDGSIRMIDGVSGSKAYKVNEVEKMVEDINLTIENTTSTVYFDVVGGSQARADALESTLHIQLNAKRPGLDFKKAPKDKAAKISFFEGKVKLHGNKVDFQEVTYARNSDGTITGTQNRLLYVKGKLQNVVLQVTAKTKEIVDAFFRIFRELTLSPNYRNKRLSDLVAKARSDLKKNYPELTDEDLNVMFVDELKQNYIVQHLIKHSNNNFT